MASSCKPCPPAKPETSLPHPPTHPPAATVPPRVRVSPSEPGSGPSAFVASLSPFQPTPELERVPVTGKARGASPHMEPIQSWTGLGRTEAANPNTKTCLKEPAQVPSLLPQLVALFPYTTPEGSRLAPPLRTVNLFCSLALHSLPGQTQAWSGAGGWHSGTPHCQQQQSHCSPFLV